MISASIIIIKWSSHIIQSIYHPLCTRHKYDVYILRPCQYNIDWGLGHVCCSGSPVVVVMVDGCLAACESLDAFDLDATLRRGIVSFLLHNSFWLNKFQATSSSFTYILRVSNSVGDDWAACFPSINRWPIKFNYIVIPKPSAIGFGSVDVWRSIWMDGVRRIDYTLRGVNGHHQEKQRSSSAMHFIYPRIIMP